MEGSNRRRSGAGKQVDPETENGRKPTTKCEGHYKKGDPLVPRVYGDENPKTRTRDRDTRTLRPDRPGPTRRGRCVRSVYADPHPPTTLISVSSELFMCVLRRVKESSTGLKTLC